MSQFAAEFGGAEFNSLFSDENWPGPKTTCRSWHIKL